jgi:regulator of sigma E protease
MEPFTPRIYAILDSILPESPANKAGLTKGDIITEVNNKPIQYWNEFTKLVRNNSDKNPMAISVNRDGETKTFQIVPDEDNKLGVYPKGFTDDVIEIHHNDYTFGESMGLGMSKAYWTLKDYMGQFKYVFTQKGATSLGGFITIGNIFPSKWNWQAFWSITALLSIMLGFMNLLPIPALDGGHVVFVLYEMVTGRKPSDTFLEYAQITGFVILMALLLFANGNDIYKWITGQL